MTIRTPDYAVGSLVGHLVTQEVGHIRAALPAGFDQWLYSFEPVGRPSVRLLSHADNLVRFPFANVTPLPVRRPAPRPDPSDEPRPAA